MNNPTYLLPIAILLDLLSRQKVSGSVHARLLSLRIKNRILKDVFHAEIVLLRGRVQSCTIRTPEGTILLQEWEAQQAIPPQEICWTFEPATHPPSESGKPPASLVPARRLAPTPDHLLQWTRKHRRAFALVDSKKTISDIATLLGTSCEDIERVLRDLPTYISFDKPIL